MAFTAAKRQEPHAEPRQRLQYSKVLVRLAQVKQQQQENKSIIRVVQTRAGVGLGFRLEDYALGLEALCHAAGNDLHLAVYFARWRT